MYNPDYPNFGPVGWTCPKCGRVYAPSQPYCLYCNDRRVTYATQTTIKPEWIYKEDTSTGKVIDEWWNRPTSICDDDNWWNRFTYRWQTGKNLIEDDD